MLRVPLASLSLPERALPWDAPLKPRPPYANTPKDDAWLAKNARAVGDLLSDVQIVYDPHEAM
jgi:hypothetical protein